jgi:hypothetical protein
MNRGIPDRHNCSRRCEQCEGPEFTAPKVSRNGAEKAGETRVAFVWADDGLAEYECQNRQ